MISDILSYVNSHFLKLSIVFFRLIYIGVTLQLKATRFLKRNQTVADVFRQTVSKHPHKTVFIFEKITWTFQEVEDFSNRIANYFKTQGYQKGDVIALFLESCPEYVGIWLGLSKLGVITALINTNLTLDLLWHCISVANARAIIFGTDLSGNSPLHSCYLGPSRNVPCVKMTDWCICKCVITWSRVLLGKKCSML